MNFFEAMVALQMGASVRSVHGAVYHSAPGGHVLDTYQDPYGFELEADEINSEWEVVEPEHDFEWAMNTLIEGDKVRRTSWARAVHFNVADDGRLIISALDLTPLTPERLIEWVGATDWVRA